MQPVSLFNWFKCDHIMEGVMKSIASWSLVSLMALTACEQAAQESQSPAADLVLTGGTIYTVDGDARTVSALAVTDGKIVYVGDDAGAQAYVDEGTDVRDLAGRAVFPGFTDSHAHLPDGGGTLLGLGLGGIMTEEEVLAEVKAYAEAHPDLPFIVGSGWELSLFKDANPHKSLLDAIVPDRPVFLVAADGHNGWANSKALENAGITAETQDPPKGRIERDEAGNPTGTLREAAQGLIAPILPTLALEDVVNNLEAGMAYQLGHGITATIDAAIMADVNEAAYLSVASRADLPHRVRVSLLAADEFVTSNVTEENAEATVTKLLSRREAYRAASAGRLDAEAVKIFVDGVVENYTAAMLDPYVGTPLGDSHRGVANLTEPALTAYSIALDRADSQIHMPALGDRAVRAGLNAIEAVNATNGDKDRRHHLAHLEIVQPEDIARFAPLGVTANLQTLWHFEDAYISDLTRPYLREELHRWLYPAKSFVEAGTRIVWGSDWPVSTSDPFDSIEVAVTRLGPDGEDVPVLVPEEALSVDDMIRALTINGAYLMGQEDIRGSLEVGKQADFFIASADPYKVSFEDLSEIEALETFVGGASVFKR
jgi:predicted amidohydrolase YtcJ